ncbi:MAG TPA: DUF4301 family protein [Flavobacteriaceae bacterium]|nr:DUF4301 family protein [Flavobacteriaceae bacterium]
MTTVPTITKLDDEIEKQLRIFKQGIPYVNIVAPASIGKGILKLSPEEQAKFAAHFEKLQDQLEIVKFVPASGAATRMFKFLHQFLEDYNPDREDVEAFLEKEEHLPVKEFFEGRKDFAFHDLIMEQLVSKYPEYHDLPRGRRYFLFVKEMLDEEGLNFGDIPKGLVPFHNCTEDYRTAFGEQLYESVFYAASNGKAKVHFTVSPQHEEKFRRRFEEIERRIEEITNVEFDVSYSFQKKETDTVAVTPENELYYDEHGSLLFRPSGHGALLENLNDIDADIIFIKNIDNVIHRKHTETIGFYKKMLAGKLLEVQQSVYNFLQKAELSFDENLVEEIKDFTASTFHLSGIPTEKKQLIHLLNRPLRVCGVVENTGAPGGGPFLVKHPDEHYSYQIVEMSQIDPKDEKHMQLVSKATHFNPVDLVCGVRNYKGEKFNLMEFCDPNTGLITEKSHQGKPIKALERPGLWNGAMAHWNTIFVEVPLITFNPVKTVNDLLNDAHQAK